MLIDFGVTRVVPDWHVTEQTAPGYSRIYWVHSGKVAYVDEEESVTLQKDCLYLFPSSAPYSMTHQMEDPLECLFFHVDLFPACAERLYAFPVAPGGFLWHLLHAAEIAAGEGQRNLLTPTAQVLIEFFRKEGVLSEPCEEIAPLLYYVASHLTNPPDLNELSRMAGYHPQYFIRYFRKKMGVTPYQYIYSCRMKEAAKLLREGRPVGVVSGAVGYGDVKTFEQAFKKRFEVSPSGWRRVKRPQP